MEIFDTESLIRNHARFDQNSGFLFEFGEQELQSRLDEIKREFTTPLQIGHFRLHHRMA